MANVGDLHPSRDQPRQYFDDDALDELAQSIRELGVLEPLVVRRRAAGGYDIISGERR
jgi:ParB family chromosome partitioning protein